MRRTIVIASTLLLVSCVDGGRWAQMRSEPIITKHPPVTVLVGELFIPPTEKITPNQPGGYIIQVWASALPIQQLVDFYFGNFFERYQLTEASERRPGYERQFTGRVGDTVVFIGISFTPPVQSRFAGLLGPLKDAPAGTQAYSEVVLVSN